MNKICFKDFLYGYLDADTEYSCNQDKFDEIFYDKNNLFNKLSDLNRPTSIVIGRKGVGKSAYAAKLRSKTTNERLAFIIELQDVSYSDFVKISDNKSNVLGAQRYLHVWYLLLMGAVVKKLKPEDVENEKNLKLLQSLLIEFGMDIDNNLIRDILTVSKKDFKVKLSAFELQLSENDQDKKVKFHNITDFSNYFMKLYDSLGIKKDIIPIIDGVDDVLRTTRKIQTEDILSGLVRAVATLNKNSRLSRNKSKFILVIRDDIVKLLNDPDLNKIIQDCGYNLDWYNNASAGVDDLSQLFNKRLLNKDKKEFSGEKSLWENLFPFKQNGKNSWSDFLEYTLYRPRDIIKFLNQFIDDYPEMDSVTSDIYRNELRKFSQDYFYDEMTNELIGFLPREIIDTLQDVLKKLGRRDFRFDDINTVYAELYPNKFNPDEIKDILRTLFNLGYIGMLRDVKHKNGSRTHVNFKHKDPRLTIDFKSRFIVHKGLFYALNI